MSDTYGDFDSFLKQKALASMGYYRERQSGHWGPKSEASYDKAKEWWDREVKKLAPASKPATPSQGFSVPSTIGSMPHRMVAIASREIGVKEEGGNNRGSKIREYQKATWLDPGAWPWCAAWICWVVKEALTGYRAPQDFERPRTAGAWDFERWAMEDAGQSVTLRKPAADIQAGDIVCFTFSHIGLAISAPKDGYLNTIEGNTNGGGDREGDGVYAKKRPVSKIRSSIRLGF